MTSEAVTLIGVNDEIREKVRQRLKAEGLSRSALADELGVSHQYVSALLRGEKGGVTQTWERILKRLGLRIVVVPYDAEIVVGSSSDA